LNFYNQSLIDVNFPISLRKLRLYKYGYSLVDVYLPHTLKELELFYYSHSITKIPFNDGLIIGSNKLINNSQFRFIEYINCTNLYSYIGKQRFYHIKPAICN
jgi:hypothetical protein